MEGLVYQKKRKVPKMPIFLAMIVMVLFSTVETHALLMEGSFEGVVTSTYSSGAGTAIFSSLNIQVGDPIYGIVAYESTQPVYDSITNQAWYEFDPASPINYVSMSIGSNNWETGTRLSISVINDNPIGSTMLRDTLFFNATSFSEFSGSFGVPPWDRMVWSWNETVLLPSSPTFLQSTALPDQTLNFSNVVGEGTLASGPYDSDNVWSIFFKIGAGKSSLTPVTPVPEPGTMLLLATGLVGLVGASRRYKKN